MSVDMEILNNRIEEIVKNRGDCLPKVFGHAAIEYLTLPRALTPILPRGKRIYLDSEHFVADRIREIKNGKGYSLPSGSFREFRLLYEHRDKILQEIPEKNRIKRMAIENLVDLDWTKWCFGETTPKGPPFGASWDFIFCLEYPINMQAEVLSKKLGLSDVEKLTKLRYSVEFTAMDYCVSLPTLEIYGKSQGSSYEDYCLIAKPDRNAFERSQISMVLELSPMAQSMIKKFDQLISDLKLYRRKFGEITYNVTSLRKKLKGW